MHAKTIIPLSVVLLLYPAWASAHPHVFADAKLEIVANKQGKIQELQNVWRFDEVFSSSVIMDFDKNGDLKLDKKELADVGDTIKKSLADFNYFTSISENGKDIKVHKPKVINVDFKDGQMILIFAVKPATPMPLKGTMSFGIYDPTFYTSIDFVKDSDMTLHGKAFKACKHKVIRPDPDEVMAENQATITQAFFDDPAGTNTSKLFATRIQIKC